MKQETKIWIFGLDKVRFTNKNTGEVSFMCNMCYLLEKEATDKSVGCAVMNTYIKAENFEKLKPLLMKNGVNATFELVSDTKNPRLLKPKFIKINDVIL